MGDMVIHVVHVIVQLLLDILGYGTARVILPLLSVGFLQVQSLSEEKHAAWWWQRPLRRLPTGRVEVSSALATLIGLEIWGLLIIGFMLQYKATLG